MRVAEFEFAKQQGEIWYRDTKDPDTKIYMDDPEVVVDAIVHCIDRTSGREAVHDPDADHDIACLGSSAEDGLGDQLGRQAYRDKYRVVRS